MKANDQKERDQWLTLLENSITKSKEDLKNKATDEKLLKPFKENLYEAFSSRLFVDECDLDTKL